MIVGSIGDQAEALAFQSLGQRGGIFYHLLLIGLKLRSQRLAQGHRLGGDHMGKNYPNFPAAQAVSAVAGLVLIPVLFYTYTGVLGRDLHWADVAIFLIAALVTALLQGRLLWRGSLSAPWQQAAGVLILWGLAVAFLYCTFHPPALPLFRDPVTLLSGVPK